MSHDSDLYTKKDSFVEECSRIVPAHLSKILLFSNKSLVALIVEIEPMISPAALSSDRKKSVNEAIYPKKKKN